MKKTILLNMLMLTLVSTGFSQTAPTADKIMTQVDQRTVPKDMSVFMKMLLVDNKEQTRERTIKTYKLGDEKQIMWFLSPADVKGSSFLLYSHDDADDDMWIYLPAFGKVRRVASSAKNGSFMGTDFTFEDLGDRNLKDYSYSLLKEDRIGDKSCWVIESVPRKGVSTDYSKIISWIWKDDFIAIKEELYNKKGTLAKIKSIDLLKVSKYWVPSKIQLKDIKASHRTVLEFNNIKVDTGIKESVFSTNYMTRIQ